MVSVDTLVSYAEELEAETAGTGLTWLKARRTEALAKINGGGGSQIISTTVNGQTFSRRVDGTAQDWFDVLQAAITQLNGTAARVAFYQGSEFPH